MKYVLFTIMISCAGVSFCDNCKLLLDDLERSIIKNHITSVETIDPKILQLCFNASLIVTNDYQGENNTNYDHFLEILYNKDLSDSKKEMITLQVTQVLSQFMSSVVEAQHTVNTVAFWSFSHNNRNFHIIETGWGDNDHLYYAFFLENKIDILLSGSN